MLLKRRSNSIITITCTQEQITYCSIESDSKNRYRLQAFQVMPITNYALLNGKIFNPTSIKKSLQTFIANNNVRTSWIVCSIQAKETMEDFIDMPCATPTRADFRLPNLDRLVWDHHYLCAKENGLFSFYIAGIPQSLLIQYKLLIASLNLLPLAITTQTMAHLNLYRYMYGSAFRTSQLAHDLQQHNYQLINYFSREIVQRIFAYTKNHMHDHAQLATALGLFLIGKNIYEQH